MGYFSIEMHHGRNFRGSKGRRMYFVGGNVDAFVFCNVEEMSIIELSSMAKELELHGSNLYSVKCGREYKDIKTDMDALELYKYLAGKRVVHVYVEPNVAIILGGIGTSTNGMVGRSLRNHENSSSLASVGIVKNSSRLRQDKTDVGGPSIRTQEADVGGPTRTQLMIPTPAPLQMMSHFLLIFIMRRMMTMKSSIAMLMKRVKEIWLFTSLMMLTCLTT